MTQQEVIKAFMKSLNDTTLKGGAAVDAAIKTSSGSKFKNFNAVKTQFLKDQKAAANWHTFLVEKCGIVLDNADTGAISGSDAGGSKAKTATTLLPSTGTAKYPEDKDSSFSSFTVDGLTIYGIPDKSRLTKDQQYVVKGLYSWWIKDALALIKTSYGLSFTDAGTTNSRLKLKFVNDESEDFLAYVSFDSDDDKVYESRVLCVNMASFKDMKDTNRHGTTDTAALDRVLVHELVHGIMASNINYFYNLPDFLKEGGTAELVHGLDDENYDEIVSYAKDPSIFEKILTTTQFEEPPYEIYTGGYIFMRYFAKQAGTDTTFAYDTNRKTISIGSKGGFATNYWDKVTMKGGKGSDTITNSGSNVSITAGEGKDTIKTYSDKVTVNAGAGNDFVFNEGSTVKIIGGAGNDSVKSNGSEVSISGGAGNDSIKNIISGYETVEAFTDEELEEGIRSTNGVTVAAADEKFYVANLTGGDSTTILGGAGADKIINQASDVLIYGDADADKITNYGFNVTIYGGDANDVILNSATSLNFDEDVVSISAYQSTIYGGAGNDSIKNEADEVKVYGEGGKDSIYNYGEDVSIYGGAGVDYVENEGYSAYLSLGDGNDVIENSSDYVSANGGAGEDFIYNEGDESTLNGGDDDDSILNYGDSISAAGGNGNDYIYSCGEQVSLSSGAGDDYICNEGVKVYITGGDGKDTIFNEGDHVTISGDKGNDAIYNDEGRYITYNFGNDSGKDTIFGFNANDTIKITSGTHSAKKSGNNVIVSVGSNALTLQDAVGKKINFISSSGKATSKTYKTKSTTPKALKISKTAEVSSRWFDEENNFITSGGNLSSIVRDKTISATNSAELNFSTSLTKKNNLVTFSGKK